MQVCAYAFKLCVCVLLLATVVSLCCQFAKTAGPMHTYVSLCHSLVLYDAPCPLELFLSPPFFLTFFPSSTRSVSFARSHAHTRHMSFPYRTLSLCLSLSFQHTHVQSVRISISRQCLQESMNSFCPCQGNFTDFVSNHLDRLGR